MIISLTTFKSAKTSRYSKLGKTIGQVDVRKHYNINIIAIKKDDDISVTPGASHILNSEESLLVLGKDKDIRSAFHILG